jgi:hypothetical protein
MNGEPQSAVGEEDAMNVPSLPLATNRVGVNIVRKLEYRAHSTTDAIHCHG